MNITTQSTTALTVARTGTTYAFQVDTNATDSATGIRVTALAAGSRASIDVLSSAGNEGLDIDAKGTGTIRLGNTSTGDIVISGNMTVAGTTVITSASASAFEVGPNGGTNPVIRINASVASAATGIVVQGNAAGSGAGITVISSGADEALTVDAKGTSTITLNGTATGRVIFGQNITMSQAASTIIPGATSFAFRNNANTQNNLFIANAGNLFINDDANTNSTIGLTINQGANDDTILALKSSDVVSPFTALQEADTFGAVLKVDATAGGLFIMGLKSSAGAAGEAILLVGRLGETADTTKSTLGLGIIHLRSSVSSGTGEANVGLDGNLVNVSNNGTTRFILDGEGDSHQDVGTAWTNFDEYDDLALIEHLARAVAKPGDPLRRQFNSILAESRQALEDLPGKKIVHFNADNHHFVNMSRLTMLLTGAVRQLSQRLQLAESRLTLLTGGV